jgi:hypothetical protein
MLPPAERPLNETNKKLRGNNGWLSIQLAPVLAASSFIIFLVRHALDSFFILLEYDIFRQGQASPDW